MAASGHADERDQQLIFLHPVGSNDQQKARRRTQLINSWECKQTTYQDQIISEYRNTGLIREEWKSGSYITEISLALSCSNRMIFHQIQIIPRGLLDPSSLSSVRFRMFWNSIHRGGTWKSYFFCTFPLFLSLYFFLLFFLYFFLVRRVLSTDGGHNGRQNKRNTAGEYPGPLIRPTRLPILHQTRHEEKEKAATGWDPLRGFKSLYHRTFISLARRKRVRKKKIKKACFVTRVAAVPGCMSTMATCGASVSPCSPFPLEHTRLRRKKRRKLWTAVVRCRSGPDRWPP